MRYVDGNRLTLLRNGEQYFPALVEASVHRGPPWSLLSDHLALGARLKPA